MIYLSGSITSQTSLANAFGRYDNLGKAFRKKGYECWVPHQQFLTPDMYDEEVLQEYEKTVPAKQIFHTDCEGIVRSDTIVAIMDTTSHGVGAEIAFAFTFRPAKNVIICHKKETRVSKFITGMVDSFSEYENYDGLTTCVEYENDKDLVEKVHDLLK